MPYRPQIMPVAGDPVGDVNRALDNALAFYFGMKDREAAQKEAERQRQMEDFRFRAEVEADPRYTTEQPGGHRVARGTRLSVPEVFGSTGAGDMFQNERIGMARGTGSPRQDIFQGERPGMAAGTTGRSPLVTDVQPGDRSGGLQAGLLRMPKEMAPNAPGPVVLPGQFVPGRGFSPTAVYEPFRFETTPAEQPVATVGGMDIYRQPGYVPPEEQANRDREEMIGLVRRAQAGDQNALTELMVRDRALAGAVSAERPPSFGERLSLAARATGGDEQAQLELLLRDPKVYDELFPETEADQITRLGMTVPNTPEGRRRLYDYIRQSAAAGRTPQAAGGAYSEDALTDYALQFVDKVGGDIDTAIGALTGENDLLSGVNIPDDERAAILETLRGLRAEKARRGFLGIGTGGGGGLPGAGFRLPTGGGQ